MFIFACSSGVGIPHVDWLYSLFSSSPASDATITWIFMFLGEYHAPFYSEGPSYKDRMDLPECFKL